MSLMSDETIERTCKRAELNFDTRSHMRPYYEDNNFTDIDQLAFEVAGDLEGCDELADLLSMNR